MDPFQPNAFDPYNRPHVYSEWWLGLGRLGLGRTDTLWLGVLLTGAVLVMAVVMVRPSRRREALVLAGTWPPGIALGMLKVSLTLSQLCTSVLVACLLRFLFGYVGRRGRALPGAPC